MNFELRETSKFEPIQDNTTNGSTSSDTKFCFFCNRFGAKILLTILAVAEILVGTIGSIGIAGIWFNKKFRRVFESTGFMSMIKHETSKLYSYENFYSIIQVCIYGFMAVCFLVHLMMAIILLLGLLQNDQFNLKLNIGWKWLVLAIITLIAIWFTFDIFFKFSLLVLTKLLLSYVAMIFHAFVVYQLSAYA